MPLESRGDALYLGTIYIGSPNSQPAKLVFDTGSEFLAVTSTLCSDETTPEKYRFKKYDPLIKDFIKRDKEEKKKSRCLSSSYNVEKSESQKIMSEKAKIVSYGSGNFEGFLFEDYVCINPIKGNIQQTVKQALIQKSLSKK